MDELDIAGRQFISTRRAGREHGYHSDYIGQLIRGGKVAGQKVGRAWYVDAQSLAEYLGKPYAVPQKTALVEQATGNEKVLDKISENAGSVEPEASIPVAVEKTIEKPVAEAAVAERATVSVTAQEEKIPPIVEERAVPVHVSPAPRTEEKDHTPSGLVYIEDDVPSLPQVQNAHAHSTVPLAQSAVATASNKRGSTAAIVALASMVGIAVVLGIGVAAYVSSGVKVAGETATIYYAIGH